MTTTQNVAFAVACLLAGLSKGGLGGPLPVSMIVPLLALVMPPQEAVPLTTPFLIFADWFALRIYWRQWNLSYVILLLPAAIIGIIIGGLSLAAIDPRTLKIIIGIATLLVIVYKLVADKFTSVTYHPRKWHGYLAGGLSGFSSTLANVGAPPFTIYMLLQNVTPIVFMGTTTLFFAIVNLLKVPIFVQQGLLDVEAILGVLWALPIIPLGVWIGRRSLDYISPQTFERIIMGLLIITVLLLLGTL